MKVLLLGGTGVIGTYLLQLLKEQDIEVFVTSRRCIKSHENLHYIQGNAKDLVFLHECLQIHKWDAIVDFMNYNTQSFKERVDMLLNRTKQYVFLSSARVYANSERLITEASPRLLEVSTDVNFLKTDGYALTKARQEDILKKTGKRNWTIIRPYITCDNNKLDLGVWHKEVWLYRALHNKTIILPIDICHVTTTLTHGLDVAKGIVALIGNSQAYGDAFHITTNSSITWQEVLDIYIEILKKYLGKKPKILLVEMARFSILFSENQKYTIVYDRVWDRRFDNSKIAQFVDIGQFYESKYFIKNALEEFLQKIQFKNINYELMAKLDKMANETMSLKKIPGTTDKITYLLAMYCPPILKFRRKLSSKF